MKKKEIKGTEVRGVGEFVQVLSQRVMADRRLIWFRGHRSAEWPVVPTIWRAHTPDEERNFTHRFRARAASRHQSSPGYDDLALWLSLMQHYGLPTRLLDWTRSPLVALYFALEGYLYGEHSEPRDAAIWILEPHVLNQIEVKESVTPSIDARLCDAFLEPAFYHRKRETNKVICAMAAEKDPRMFVQQGCFTIHSDRRPLNLRAQNARYLSRIVIPAASVKSMAFEVDLCGFRKGDIFPDLGNLALELKSRRNPL